MRHLAVVVLVALLALQGNAQTNSSCSTDAYTCSLDSDCLFGVCVGSQCITTEGGTLGHVCAATGTDGLTEGTCRDGLYCDSSSQLCTTLLTNGTACTQSGSCEHGLACSTICRTVLLPGDACVFGAETQVCVNSGGAIGGHECNSTTLVCEGTDHNTTTQGEAGDECCPDAGGLGCASNVGHGCDVGLYCNGGIMSSGICVAKVAANGACDPQLQDDACDAGLVCGFNSNVCEPHHGVELGHVCTADTDCQFFPGGAVQCKSSVCTAVTSADTCSQAAPTCGEYSYCTCSTNLTESAPTCVLQFAPDLSQDANGTWTDLQACMVTNACHAGHYLMHDPVYMLSSSTNCKLCTSEFIAHECAMNRDISWRGATGLSGVTVAACPSTPTPTPTPTTSNIGLILGIAFGVGIPVLGVLGIGMAVGMSGGTSGPTHVEATGYRGVRDPEYHAGHQTPLNVQRRQTPAACGPQRPGCGPSRRR